MAICCIPKMGDCAAVWPNLHAKYAMLSSASLPKTLTDDLFSFEDLRLRYAIATSRNLLTS
ncbi:hypothetical protein HA62_11090 [Pseudomonas putida]|nr:hypothetical protein HA62_11090 [Pseudomonas putida]